jgi:hypothetical protein
LGFQNADSGVQENGPYTAFADMVVKTLGSEGWEAGDLSTITGCYSLKQVWPVPQDDTIRIGFICNASGDLGVCATTAGRIADKIG